MPDATTVIVETQNENEEQSPTPLQDSIPSQDAAIEVATTMLTIQEMQASEARTMQAMEAMEKRIDEKLQTLGVLSSANLQATVENQTTEPESSSEEEPSGTPVEIPATEEPKATEETQVESKNSKRNRWF
jgi:hypothetical protein